MKKELTAPEIEKLYAFLQKKYVDTYDIQTELVDHLASDIEIQWEKNPDLTLEDAMLKVYKKFGIFGFMDVYGERVAAIKRQIRMHWLRTFFKFFKLPYLLFSIVLFIGFQQALTSLGLALVMILSLGILYVGIIYIASNNPTDVTRATQLDFLLWFLCYLKKEIVPPPPFIRHSCDHCGFSCSNCYHRNFKAGFVLLGRGFYTVHQTLKNIRIKLSIISKFFVNFHGACHAQIC